MERTHQTHSAWIHRLKSVLITLDRTEIAQTHRCEVLEVLGGW